MSERFTASNGWYVEDQWLHNPQGARGCRVNAGAMLVTAIEYGRHLERTERDVELGRWRSKEHPDYVLYAGPKRDLVLDERSGVSVLVSAGSVQGGGVFEAVAREFFDAQELPRPWLDAQPDEVWVLTYANMRVAAATVVKIEGAVYFDHGSERKTVTNPSIVRGRRIWPESREASGV